MAFSKKRSTVDRVQSFWIRKRLRILGFSSLSDYYQSQQWRETKRKFKRDRCYQCGKTRALQLHHLTYQRLGNEHPSDCVWLCGEHHRQIHDAVKRGKPWDQANKPKRRPTRYRNRFTKTELQTFRKVEKKRLNLRYARLPDIFEMLKKDPGNLELRQEIDRRADSPPEPETRKKWSIDEYLAMRER